MVVNAADARSYRLTSIDLLRGLVIVIMAIDHVRDYFYYSSPGADPLAAGAIEWDLYLTRWITHFCAPVFVFLAGTSAGLMSERKSSNELGAFLVKRGLWLIFVEVVIISTAWTFSPLGIPEFGGQVLVVMQVIWVIGASMVILGGLQYLPVNIVLGIGIAIILGHNSLDYFWPLVGNFGFDQAPAWVILHAQSSITAGDFHIWFYYPLLPWIGVMAFGYGSARLFTLNPVARKRALIVIGGSLISAFFVLRTINGYGEPVPWVPVPGDMLQSTLSYMKVSKYPPSLMFLAITLGPAFLVLAYAESWRGRFAGILITFGRVPFLFYVLHIYFIHLLAATVGTLLGYDASAMWGFFIFYPEGWGFGLPAVYLIWIFVVASLYPICAWFARIKQVRKDWWLSYL